MLSRHIGTYLNEYLPRVPISQSTIPNAQTSLLLEYRLSRIASIDSQRNGTWCEKGERYYHPDSTQSPCRCVKRWQMRKWESVNNCRSVVGTLDWIRRWIRSKYHKTTIPFCFWCWHKSRCGINRNPISLAFSARRSECFVPQDHWKVHRMESK